MDTSTKRVIDTCREGISDGHSSFTAKEMATVLAALDQTTARADFFELMSKELAEFIEIATEAMKNGNIAALNAKYDEIDARLTAAINSNRDFEWKS